MSALWAVAQALLGFALQLWQEWQNDKQSKPNNKAQERRLIEAETARLSDAAVLDQLHQRWTQHDERAGMCVSVANCCEHGRPADGQHSPPDTQ